MGSDLECTRGRRHITEDTCIQALAAGWILHNDLCPQCTTRFMAALDGLEESLSWHEAYLKRAAGEVPETWKRMEQQKARWGV